MAGYGSDEGFAAYLLANGLSLPVGAPSVAVLRQRGSTYIDGLYGARFLGVPTGGYSQDRSWPRTGATAYGSSIPDDVIPDGVVQASYHAAYQEGVKSGSLSVAASSAKSVKREKIDGAVEREYFEGTGSAVENATLVLSPVEGLIAPFLVQPLTSGFLSIRSVG